MKFVGCYRDSFLNRIWPLIAFVVLFVLGIYVQYARLNSLDFHTRDFAFYAEFAQKAFRPEMPKIYGINPGGQNMFGYVGIEGSRGFHFTIHLEPVKYILAFAEVFSPVRYLGAFSVFSFIIFSPLLYGWYLRRLGCHRPLLEIASLYLIYPAAFWAVGYDLRPYALMGSVFLLAVMAQAAARPLPERLAFIVALLLIREEGIVFASAIGLMSFVWVRKRKDVVASLCIWLLILAYGLMVVGYFHFAAFDRAGARGLSVFSDYRYAIMVKLLVLWAVAAMGLLILIFIKPNNAFQRLLAVILLGVPLVPMAWQFIHMNYPDFVSMPRPDFMWQLIIGLIEDPRYNLYVAQVTAILMVLIPARRSQERCVSRTIVGAIAACVFITLLLISWISFKHRTSEKRTCFRDLVNNLEKIEPLQNTVFCDYATQQAFAHIAIVYNFQRLPYQLAKSEPNLFPENRHLLKRLLKNERNGSIVVISTQSAGTLLPWLAAEQIPLREVYKNEMYYAGELCMPETRDEEL
ncbi:MAG TPA: hypothetical protein PLT67_02560 [Kiritimatiellia bacterium]|nr:hypothetical protein [Kiritimatiellia bacterium]